MDLVKIGQLDELHHGKWFTQILRKSYTELELKNKELMYQLMLKDIELAKLRSDIFKNVTIKNAATAVKDAAAEYEALKAEFSEKFLEGGHVLSEKTLIDDITFEVFLEK